jgi:hypothetical protein
VEVLLFGITVTITLLRWYYSGITVTYYGDSAFIFIETLSWYYGDSAFIFIETLSTHIRHSKQSRSASGVTGLEPCVLPPEAGFQITCSACATLAFGMTGVVGRC